ncbi:ATP-binding protein [Streptomyces humi]
MEPGPGAEEDAARGEGDIRTGVALEGDGACIARARHLAAEFLAVRVRDGHGLFVSQRAMDLTQLVVSELVTNALKYAPGPLLMTLCIVDGTVEVEVWDSDPVLPSARAADAGRIGQHGLEIVKAVAQHLNARAEPVGKRITARIALADGPGNAT